VVGVKDVADEAGEADGGRARDLDDTVDRVGHGGPGYRCGDVLGGDRLEVGSGDSDRVAVGGGVGDGSQELEELCGPNDGVGLAASMSCSWATLARMYPLSGSRSAPTMDSAT
jgi:hypothetical protein